MSEEEEGATRKLARSYYSHRIEVLVELMHVTPKLSVVSSQNT